MRKFFITILLLAISAVSTVAQTNNDRVMILPFKNTSDKTEFNWVGESFVDALADLLGTSGFNTITNQERKILQQSLNIPLTSIPSLAASLKLANKANATLLLVGEYKIVPQQDRSAEIYVKARVLDVRDAKVLSPDSKDRSIKPVIEIVNALENFQEVQGELAYHVFMRRNIFINSLNELKQKANKIPAKAFEAYVKGLLTQEPQTRENYFKNSMRLYGETTSGEIYSAPALELGHFYFNQQKFSDAIEYFGRVINANEKCKDKAKAQNKVFECNDESYAEASFYVGLIQWQQKNYEQALEVLRPLADNLKFINVYNIMGSIALQTSIFEKNNKGNADKLLKEGLEFLRKASESAPDQSNVHFNYGLALFFNKNYAEAVEKLKLYLVNNSSDGEAYFITAKAFELLNDKAKADFADNQARRFLATNNRYAKLQEQWSREQNIETINMRVEQPSRKEFVNVVLVKKQSTPNQPLISETEALLEQARIFYKNGNDDEAIQVLKRFLIRDNKADAYLLLGKIYLRRASLDEAVAQLRTALFWDNKLIDGHIELGKIYLQRGDCLQAKTYSSSALAIDPENQDALGLQRQVERCSK